MKIHALLLCGLVGGAVAVVESRSSHHLPVATTGARDTRVAPEKHAPALASARFVAGVRHAYRVHADYSVDFSRTGTPAGAAARPASTLAFGIDGSWQLTIVHVGSDQILARGVLTVRVSGTHADAMAAAELARPHYVTYAPTGKLLAVHAQHGADSLAVGIVRSLAAETQLVSGEGRWQATESDPTGDYLASYVREGDAIEKRKLRYIRVATGQIDGLDAKTTMHVDDELWPEHLEANQAMMISTPADIRLSTRSSLALELASTDWVAVDVADLGGFDEIAADAPMDRGRVGADRELVGGATLDELIADLKGVDDHARARIFAQLAGFLRLHPEAAATLADHVPAEDPRTGVLIDALGDAGTSQSQAALARLLGESSRAASVRARAAVATTLLDAPSPEIVDALTRDSRANEPELRGAASLALGAAVLHLGPGGGTVVDELLARFAAATSRDDRRLVVQSLGNTGDARVLPALRSALLDPDPGVREAAAAALRLIIDPSVDELLAGAIDHDPDASVRRGAVFACGFRAIDPVLGSLGRALRQDSDAGVRREVVEVLGGHRELSAVTPLLQSALEDPATEVRDLARRLVGS